MDIGLVAGIAGLVGSAESASKGKRKCNGSDGLERSEDEEDPFSGVAVTSRSNRRPFSSEVPRSVDNLGLSDAMTCQQQQQLGLGLMRSDSSGSPQTQMLNFSSAGMDCGGFGLSDEGGDVSAKTLSYSSHRLPAAYSRNAGYYSSENMHGLGSSLTGWGLRAAFTPAQWIELEHQALIYKYLTANVPVPASLLIPIRKALCQSGCSVGSFPAYTYGWGPYHLGFSGSTDPELGRCRRTDGKKWRCSRDAVPDQKYCERHINRGRHRSRKPVEGQNGQAATVSATTSTLLQPKPVAVSGGSGLSIESGGSLAVAYHQQQHIKTKLTHGLVVPPATDLKLTRMQDSPELSGALSATMHQLKPKDPPFSYSDQQQHADHYQQEDKSLQKEFGSVSMDALLSSKTSSSSYLMDCRNNYNDNMLGFSDQHNQVDQSHHGNPLHHLSIHDWQKDEAKREMAS